MKTLIAIVLLVAALGCSENRTPYGPDAGDAVGPLACLPNLDGQLERSEMPTQLDTAVPYLVAEDATVDVSRQRGQPSQRIPRRSKTRSGRPLGGRAVVRRRVSRR